MLSPTTLALTGSPKAFELLAACARIGFDDDDLHGYPDDVWGEVEIMIEHIEALDGETGNGGIS